MVVKRSELYVSSFDADPDTLTHVQILRQLNASLAKWTEMTCLKSSKQGSIYSDAQIEFCLTGDHGEAGIDVTDAVLVGEKVAELFKGLAEVDVPPITDVYTNCLMKVIVKSCCFF